MSWVGHEMVKEALAELADADYQERVWLSGGGEEVSSIVEAVCQLFDDSGLGDALDAGSETVFDPNIDQALNALDEMVRPLTGSAASPAEILADQRLVNIRSAAAKVIFAIIRWEARQLDAQEP